MNGKSRVKISSITLLCVAIACNVSILFYNYDIRQCTLDNRLLQEAEARIMKIRRDTVILDMGMANAGKNVSIRQLSHAFRFGSNLYQFDGLSNSSLNQKYRALFSALFNYATVPFYWSSYEYTRNNFADNTRLHDMVAWLASFNATAKGHPMIWQFDDVIPPWMKLLSPADQRQAALDHIDNILSQFPEIKTFDLVNEMTHVNNSWLAPTPAGTWEAALTRAKQDRNATEFIANEYTIGDGQDTRPFYDFVQQVVNDGFAPSALGFQFHTTDTWVPLQDILDSFDRFGNAFKIPCHVTEFIPGSNGTYRGGSDPCNPRARAMTEASQAEWAARVYTLLFSHPALQAITWWDFSQPAWMDKEGGYMMTGSGRVLPVYDRLFNLIHVRWNSTGTVTLNASGQAKFTGFYGRYVATVQGGGSSKSFEIIDDRLPGERPWLVSDVK